MPDHETYISKQETQILKGIAILLMLFLHLFIRREDADLCNNLIYIGDLPLVHILTRACNPVDFFLILGGYGLYIVYRKGDTHRYTRILRLLIHYWTITFIFSLVRYFLFPERETYSLTGIIFNIATFKRTFEISEMWFLCPYLFLSVTSAWLFRFTERFRIRYILIFLFMLHLCTSFLISRYGVQFFFYHDWIYIFLLYFHLMFAFFLGAMAAKAHFFSYLTNYSWRMAWPVLLLLIIIRCMFTTGILHTFYVFAFIFLFLKAKRLQHIDKALYFLGAHSMNIWMIHSWFNKYLFHDFMYEFKYPILIFIVLLSISLLCSFIINAICAPIKKICKV